MYGYMDPSARGEPEEVQTQIHDLWKLPPGYLNAVRRVIRDDHLELTGVDRLLIQTLPTQPRCFMMQDGCRYSQPVSI